MGYKSVCINCRKAFSQGMDFTKFNLDKHCPDCGEPMVFLSQSFRPPKKTDDKKWKVVEFLIKNGFRYNHVWKNIRNGGYEGYAAYPENMSDAIRFIKKYKK